MAMRMRLVCTLLGPTTVAGRAPVRLPDAPPWPELQATPTMGYNGWLSATMGHEPGARNQTLYYNIADKLVASGLAAAGYDTLLTVCLGWVRDPITSKLEAPRATWPDGFKALVDYAHAKGIKVGAYTDTGAIGCCHIDGKREIGSFGHEELDVQQFAEWGVDHISVDNCGHPGGASQSVFEYVKIHDALVKVGKPMVCESNGQISLPFIASGVGCFQFENGRSSQMAFGTSGRARSGRGRVSWATIGGQARMWATSGAKWTSRRGRLASCSTLTPSRPSLPFRQYQAPAHSHFSTS